VSWTKIVRKSTAAQREKVVKSSGHGARTSLAVGLIGPKHAWPQRASDSAHRSSNPARERAPNLGLHSHYAQRATTKRAAAYSVDVLIPAQPSIQRQKACSSDVKSEPSRLAESKVSRTLARLFLV
jgi:hypothetical protein